jgi:glutamate formiminotransferase
VILLKLIETLPNISEGRNSELIRQIKNLADNFDKVWFISCKSDEYFNRSFISIVGDISEIDSFLYETVKICIEKIDLTKHSGHHPRIGAVDVVPIVPLIGVNFEEANYLVEKLSQKISNDFNLPVYLYEKSARYKERQNINNIRKGEFEFLEKKMKLPEWKPDYGPSKPHPTAGATIIGVRDFLITLDFHINTTDRWLAEQIQQELSLYAPVNVFLIRKQNGKFSISINAKEGEISIYLLYNQVQKVIQHFGCEIERVSLPTPITGKIFLNSFKTLIGNLDGELFTIEEKLLLNSQPCKSKNPKE